MKINYAYVAMKLTDEDADVLHMVLYEEKPDEINLVNVIEELATDESFGLTDMVIGKDYELYYFEGEKLDKVRGILGIPEEIDETQEPV